MTLRPIDQSRHMKPSKKPQLCIVGSKKKGPISVPELPRSPDRYVVRPDPFEPTIFASTLMSWTPPSRGAEFYVLPAQKDIQRLEKKSKGLVATLVSFKPLRAGGGIPEVTISYVPYASVPKGLPPLFATVIIAAGISDGVRAIRLLTSDRS